MKNNFIKFALPLVVASLLFAGCSSSQAVSQAPSSAPITYQTFYDDLSPYGTWIDYPGYGQVWNPSGIDDFRPYVTNGYWDYSNAGWGWFSNYSWGWAPFHYGRWFYDDMYGWLWVPGYDWSPAWVTWGTVGDSYCWAPLLPDVFVGAQFGNWRPPSFYWNFAGRDHIYDRNLSGEVQRQRGVHSNDINRITIVNNFNTTRVNKRYYSKGPELNEVERYTNRQIQPVSFRDVTKRSDIKHEGNNVNVYRPQVQRTSPREFRSVEPTRVRPILHEEQPVIQRHDQENNIRQLPTQRMESAPRNVEGGQDRRR